MKDKVKGVLFILLAVVLIIIIAISFVGKFLLILFIGVVAGLIVVATLVIIPQLAYHGYQLLTR